MVAVILFRPPRNSYYLPAVIEVPIVPKRPVNAAVIEGIAASKHTAIAEAMRPYSIAVAPDSSFKNLFILKLSKKIYLQHLSEGLADAWLPVDKNKLAPSN